MVRSRAVVVVTLAATSVLGWWFGDQRRAADTPYRVVQVLDGDTIVVRRAGGSDETIRLLGVDTPNCVEPHGRIVAWGEHAPNARRDSGQPSTRGSAWTVKANGLVSNVNASTAKPCARPVTG